jgi:hypothetical protein
MTECRPSARPMLILARPLLARSPPSATDPRGNVAGGSDGLEADRDPVKIIFSQLWRVSLDCRAVNLLLGRLGRVRAAFPPVGT